MGAAPRLCVLAGGVGAARLLVGVREAGLAPATTAVVNTGDDAWIAGVRVCPDLDTITYTLAGLVNPATGWGVASETFSALAMLRRLGGPSWFTLGDRDIGLHLYRTDRLRRGDGLAAITADVGRALGVETALVPMTEDEVATMLLCELPGGDLVELGFQEYFVRHRHAPAVERIRYANAAEARATPAALVAISQADLVVIAPSNPFLSVFPILAVPGIEASLAPRRERTVAVSPIVAGTAIKGPAAALLEGFGLEASVVSIARLYAPVAGALVIDEADRALAPAVAREGLRPVVADTLIAEPAHARRLVERILEDA